MTGLELIKGAMRLAHVLGSGETPEASEAADALQLANAMLGGWNNQRLAAYHHQLEEFAWAAGQASRTMGPGGNFATTRPIRIEHAYAKDSAGYAAPLGVVNAEAYRSIGDKTFQSNPPEALFVDATFPLATLYLYPVPAVAMTLGVTSWKQFTAMTLAGQYSLPPGCDEAILYNLALRIADEWNRPIRPSVASIAATSLEWLKTVNLQIPAVDSDLDGFGTSGFNILSGGN